MLRVAICEDNNAMLNFLKQQIASILQSEHICFALDAYSDGEDLKHAHQQKEYDILFLDICMPKTSGFDLAKSVRATSQKTAIVFVTANDHLVFESFHYQPFYFIRKESIDSLRNELNLTMQKLLKTMRRHAALKLISSQSGETYIAASDIVYIESRGHYLYYKLASKEEIVVRETISAAEENLSQFDFLRIHKSYIVNMHNVLAIEKGKNEITVSGNQKLRIGRLYAQDVAQRYMEFIRETI